MEIKVELTEDLGDNHWKGNLIIDTELVLADRKFFNDKGSLFLVHEFPDFLPEGKLVGVSEDNGLLLKDFIAQKERYEKAISTLLILSKREVPIGEITVNRVSTSEMILIPIKQ